MCLQASMIKRVVLTIALTIVLLSLSACASSNSAPQQFPDGVGWVARRHSASDARTQRITQWPCLRVDPVLTDELDAALAENDFTKASSLATHFIDEAHRLSLATTEAELERFDDQAWRELMKTYFNGIEVEPTPQVRQLIADEFRHRTDLQVWFLRQKVTTSTNTSSLRAVLLPIRQNIEPSVKEEDRTGQQAALAVFALPAAMARSAIHASEATCQMDETFEGVVQFVPAADQMKPARQGDIEHWDLLVKYAPVFVQEHPGQVKYDRSADQIGLVHVMDDRTVEVNITQPTVYGYARSVMIAGQPHIQLTYATWYPFRPHLKSPVDAEAGKIDGATLRITLGANLKPAIFETLNNCGCHHRLYPSAALESAAATQHGKPLPDKQFAIERNVEGKYDLIIPKLLRIEGADVITPMVRCRAGTHAIVDVDITEELHSGEPVIERRPYRLVAYADLERLASPSGKIISMFEPNGLVRGAERLEGDLFNPLGMLSAGQPRQRGTQLIHWDQFDFDHPRLLESTLRLPAKF